jgi:hypothetical protein
MYDGTVAEDNASQAHKDVNNCECSQNCGGRWTICVWVRGLDSPRPREVLELVRRVAHSEQEPKYGYRKSVTIKIWGYQQCNLVARFESGLHFTKPAINARAHNSVWLVKTPISRVSPTCNH